MKSELRKLIANLERDITIAETIDSPNPEEAYLPIRVAIVGFSYRSETENWCLDHYQFIKRRLDEGYSNHHLKSYGKGWENVRYFSALAFGYLLGAYHEEEIDDKEFFVAEAQIAGIILLDLNKILTSQL